MADLTNTTIAANFEKAIGTAAPVSGLGSTTVVATLGKTNITNAEVVAALKAATGGNINMTVAGVTVANANVVYVALQGTSTIATTSNFGATGVTLTPVVTFNAQ